MSSLKYLLRGTAFAIIALSLYLTCVKGSYIPATSSDISSAVNLSDSDPNTYYDAARVQTTDSEDGNMKGTKEDSENSTKSNAEDRLKDIFNPFLAFPFFPFHFPNLKRDVFQGNSTERTIRIEKDNKLSGTRKKPFLFFDFAFNIREVPQKNQTDESKSTSLASASPKKVSEKSDVKKDISFDVIDDDWSFFDDSPLFSPDMDEFLPKSDFLFFDFPFRRKQSKKFVRSRRDMTKPIFKSDLNLFVDILDGSLSKAEKDLERSEPLWFQTGEDGKKVRREDGGDGFVDKAVRGGGDAKLKDGGKHDKRSMRGTKRSPYELVRHKSPVILGKVLKFGEIHFGDDYSKNKKKRRNASGTGKKGNNNRFQETSIEMVQMNEPFRVDSIPKYLELSPLHTSLTDVFHRIQPGHQESLHEKERKELHGKLSQKSEDTKILDLVSQWDRREVEQMATATTQKSETARPYTYNSKQQESGRSHSRLADEGYKYIGHNANGRYQIRDSVGFEVVKPQIPFARPKRQEGGSSIDESNTSSKEEVRRNITHVLQQFFSMIGKLGDSKSFYEDKDNPDLEDMSWPELDDALGSGSFMKTKKMRRAPPDDNTEQAKNYPIANLNYLFLTVTLPTMFAFTLLLAACFFNLRVRGWLCTKLFKPRHVYVVEGNAEKADSPQKRWHKDRPREKKLHWGRSSADDDKRKREQEKIDEL